MIDRWSYRALDISHIIERVEVYSDLGKNRRKNFVPFNSTSIEDIRQYHSRLAQVVELSADKILVDKLKSELMHVKAIHRSIDSLGEELEVFEIFEVKQFCYFYNRISKLLKSSNFKNIDKFVSLENIFNFLDPENHGTPSFNISSSFSQDLHQVREKIALKSKEKKLLLNKYKLEIKQALNIQNAEDKVTVSRYNTDMKNKLEESGYYVVSDENFANTIYSLKLPETIINMDIELNSLLIEQEKIAEEVLKYISKELYNYKDNLIKAIEVLADFDDMLGKAVFARKYSCVIPEIKQDKVSFDNAINIPTYEALKRVNIKYQKISLDMPYSMNIIVGANMAGKSTALVTLGQLAYLTQYGFPVPASKCQIPLFDFIMFSGDEANQKSIDLSSFGKEIVRVNSYLNRQGKGLFLIDEFARGTNPKEGNALSKALFEELKSKDCFSFCATHFNSPLTISEIGLFAIPGITEEDFLEIRQENQEHPENRLKALHKKMKYEIVKVTQNTKTPQAGIMIAELLGIDSKIISKAKAFIDNER